jgi:hypothetical protein
VTLALGNQNANSQVAFDFALVSGDGSGTPINSVRVGDRFGVEIYVEDLRVNSTFVFAGFLDLLYDTGIIAPSDTDASDDFDFDVEFGPGYVADAGVGTAARPGIIDEFGTLFARANVSGSEFDELNPGLLATVFFDAVGAGTTRVVGSPTDSSPFQDTLVFGLDDPIDRSRIRYDVLQFTVGSGSTLQNQSLPQDVNNDGDVSPIDALLVINQMSRVAVEGEETFAAQGITASQYFTDVNGDNLTTALDALQVINYLTRMSDSTVGGEQIAVLAESSSNESATQSSTDDVFASLGVAASSEKIVSVGTGGQSSVSALPLVDAVADDDDDDVLALIADDVSGVWS